MEAEEQMRLINALLNRIEPFVQRYLDKMIEEHGTSVTISVSSNLATSMLAMCMLIIIRTGGDVEDFMEIVVNEINFKINSTMKVVAEASQSTCQHLH